MSIDLLRFAAGLYAVAAAGYLLYFARPRYALAARFGGWFLSGGVVVHLAAIGLACKEFGGLEWFTLRGGMVLTAVLLAGTYLLVQRFYHLPSVGAFVTPLTLIILLPTLFGVGGAPGEAPAALKHPAITLHIMTASLGVALFGLAFGVAVMYLLQEREVKGKRFGALFSRLPPLDSLDKLTDRLVRLGFLSFTVASILGAVIARSVWKSAWSWDPQQVTTLLIWMLYGGMVQARHLGWHGRRYALLTVFGFALLIGSIGTLRAVPGLTMHAGEYKGPRVEAAK
jgi:HemX protein